MEDRQSNAQAYYYYVLPGDLTKQVYVWGTVRLPGVYVVGVGADLDEVLSLAGGPALPQIQDRNRREVTVRVYRTEGVVRTVAYEASLERMVLEPERHPALRSGDVVEVEAREIRPFTLRDAAPFVSAAATVLLVLERIIFQ